LVPNPTRKRSYRYTYQHFDGHPSEITHLFRVEDRVGIRVTDEDMEVFVLREPVWKINVIYKFEYFREFAIESHFLPESPVGGTFGGFVREGMTTAGIGPHATTVVFLRGPSLEHELPLRIEHPYGKSPMEESEFVRPHFFFLSDRSVMLIDKDDGMFRHGGDAEITVN
jgi:hypothetical protein